MKAFSSLLICVVPLLLSTGSMNVFGKSNPVAIQIVSSPQPIAAAGTTGNDTISKGERYYGSFVIQYVVTNAGYQLTPVLVLAGQLVGMSTLTAAAPVYQFNTIVNKSQAYGTLTSLFYPPGQVSTLEGDFFVISERSDTTRFKGTVTGWYTTAQTAPKN